MTRSWYRPVKTSCLFRKIRGHVFHTNLWNVSGTRYKNDKICDIVIDIFTVLHFIQSIPCICMTNKINYLTMQINHSIKTLVQQNVYWYLLLGHHWLIVSTFITQVFQLITLTVVSYQDSVSPGVSRLDCFC